MQYQARYVDGVLLRLVKTIGNEENERRENAFGTK
jgi:hypothetical protein